MHGVEIYALGVDASGVSFGYWRALQEFWLQFSKQSGAEVRVSQFCVMFPNWTG